MISFAELWEKTSRDVYRFSYALCGNRAQAEDITSETFVRVWTAPAAIQTATLKGYLFTIARNVFLQQLRRERQQVPLPDGIAHRDNPERETQSRNELDVVLRAMQALPEDERAALAMRVYDELPYEEIAAALGISLSAAKVKVHRARIKLMRIRHPEGARS